MAGCEQLDAQHELQDEEASLKIAQEAEEEAKRRVLEEEARCALAKSKAVSHLALMLL